MGDRPVFDLNALLACCRRELATRQRVYPKWVERGIYTEKKAEAELELMRNCVDYFVDAIFREVTRQGPPLIIPPDESRSQSRP
jgi:hypothetical protein